MKNYHVTALIYCDLPTPEQSAGVRMVSTTVRDLDETRARRAVLERVWAHGMWVNEFVSVEEQEVKS